jgi:predicted Zn-ribbon and HTH transcriptional regulator
MKNNQNDDQLKTIRQRMIDLLSDNEMNARELSQALGIREKAVYEHLSHISRTVAAQRKKLFILPFRCLTCGYVFKERNRFNPPGRCPSCKNAHLQRPMYVIR